MFDYLTKQLENIDVQVASIEKQLVELRDFKSLVERQRQKVCPHINTYTIDSMDYHNNVDWVETHCKDCGKFLSKK